MDIYQDRIDRNLGVISKKEQQKLHNSTVAIAGTGGMGGLLAVSLARIGIGRIKIADNQKFDISNLNRQYGARMSTVNKNKALITAKDIKRIIKDVEVEVFQEGVTRENVENFVEGADIICDEIEFFEARARILLHQTARRFGVHVFNCNVVGFGTRLFLFTPSSMIMEEFLDLADPDKLTENDVKKMISRLAPRLPPDISEKVLEDWVLKKRKVPIFGGTPSLSAGILQVRVCLHLIGYNTRPWLKKVPPMPGYAYFDSGSWQSEIYEGKWW